MHSRSSGNPSNTDRLSTALFVVGASLPLTVFLLVATPILILTVDSAFLAFITQLLLLLIAVGVLAFIVIGVWWLCHVVDDDLHDRRCRHEQRELDLKERKLESEERKRPTKLLRARASRFTDAAIPVVMQQQRPTTRHLNSHRPGL
ncbi:MAG TPA: hypothetical protein DHW02_14825 [Ktedonobacter sp.]|nr:hypothetical protein [Ktedonobacter sp.]